jgi:phage gp36-like protein
VELEMAYSTKDDLLGEIAEDTLRQLTDDSNLGVVDDSVVDKVLARTSAQVDGYCSNLYDVPFDPAPDFVRALDLDIAIYNLFSRRENVPENREKRFSNAVKALVAIGKGDIQLGMSGKAAPEQKGQIIAVSGPAPVFTSESLRNY